MARISLAGFIRKYDGRKVGSGQCVALARAWIANICGGNAFYGLPSVRSAKDMWTKADPKKWQKVRNGARNAPPEGALVIFAATPSNRHGHVAIARKPITARSPFYTFDQNWSRQLRCAKEAHRYGGVIGWLIKR